ETIKRVVLAGEPRRDLRMEQIHVCGDAPAERQHDGRQPSYRQRRLMHRLDDVPLLERLAEEMLDLMPGEELLEGVSGAERTDVQHAERDKDHKGAFVRRLVMMLVVRRAVECL